MKHLMLFLLAGLFSIGNTYSQTIDFEHFKVLKPRNIGPAGMSGRVTAIDVNLSDTDKIFVGTASGGVWKSENGGISWEPIFDDQDILSIGALKINQQNPDEIWVGTGEGNPRNSQNSGAGVYKSIDGGKTWKLMGLTQTKVIHRIIINQHDPNTVLIGAQGPAWGPNAERGVFKTIDGGSTWKKVLYVNDETGIGDMVQDPSNPNKIIAALWEFGRKPWTFNSGGPGSGMYISYDAGDNWKKLTSKEGLPKGDLGRMGIAFSASKPNIVYALIEAKVNGLYKSVNGGENWRLVSEKNIGNRPFYYAEIYVDPQNENRIYNLHSYVTLSEDGGKSFRSIADYGNGVHPDHHAFWINPDDPSYIIDGNDGGLAISRDGAETWQFVSNLPVGQFYHVSIDNDYPYNIYGGMQDNGSWIGPSYVLKAGGIRNYDWQEIYFGDGFDVAPKSNDNRYGYAMSQGGNISFYDRVTGMTEFIKPVHPDGTYLRYNWNAALALDPKNTCGLYYGSQFVHKSLDCGKSWEIISPDLTTNDTSKQKQLESGGLTIDATQAENHTTILCISPSPYNEKEIWAGTDDGNLQFTRDGGQNWSNLSDKLPGMPRGAWIPQIVLSDINEGEIFVVVNDYRRNNWTPYLYHSTNNGLSFNRIVDQSDVKGFVCSVIQDPEEPSLIFCGTDDGLYMSLNYGQSWQKFKNGFPSVQVRDMKIQKRESDLVLGTFGRSFWVIDDLHPYREIARTNGQVLQNDFAVFPPVDAYLSNIRSYHGIRFAAQGEFVGDNKRSGVAQFKVWKKPAIKTTAPPANIKNSKRKKKEEMKKEVKKEEGKKKGDKEQITLHILNTGGDTLRTIKRDFKEGMNIINWRLDQKGEIFPSRSDRDPDRGEPGGVDVLPGKYMAHLIYGDQSEAVEINVLADPRANITASNQRDVALAMDDYNKLVKRATEGFDKLKQAKKTIALVDKLATTLPDTLRKEIVKLNKDTKKEISSLMDYYMDAPDQKGIVRDPGKLNANLFRTRGYISSSQQKPGKNAMNSYHNTARMTEEILSKIDAFFKGDWNAYQDKIEKLKFDLFKDF